MALASGRRIRPLKPPLCLDITRSFYRQRAAPTGIDRVESAYRRFVTEREGLFLVKCGRNITLIDAEGLLRITREAPRLDLLARLAPHRNHARRSCEAALRRHANWIGPPRNRPRASGEILLNVGHSHLNALPTLAPRGAARVMIHDTIPLDWPHLQRKGSPARFARALNASTHAGGIITPSHHSAARIRAHLPGHPALKVISLGIELLPDVEAAPHPRPYILMVGTIEPRKNHLLLLNLWTQTEGLDLVLIGGRGWNNADTFRFLDQSPLMGQRIFELGPCDDRTRAAWLKGAAALAFPTRDEGFGLPLYEARAAGIPVLASDIPPLREAGSHGITFLPANDPEDWVKHLRLFVKNKPSRATYDPQEGPDWAAHFDRLCAWLEEGPKTE